jgi:hypothetical protein
MKAWGLMESTQDRSDHIGPAVFFGICALVLVFAVAYAVRQLFKENDQGK